MSIALLLLAFAGSGPQAAASPFNGVWLMDLKSSSGPPDQTHLVYRNGAFSRGDDTPDLTVKADGAFHPLPDDDYVDAAAVSALGPRRLRELDHFKGKLVYSTVYSVSADGDTITRQVTDFSKPNHRPIPTEITYRRIGRPEHGGSIITGRWRETGVKTTRDHLTETLRLDGDRFSDNGPGDYGFDAVIGGPPAPVRGDAATARTAVTMPNNRTIVEHMSLHGAPTVEMTMAMLPDDRTIRVSSLRRSDDVRSSWLIHKQ